MNNLIEEIYPQIFRVSLRIPVPLKAINIYLFKGSEGWSIVDCGFHDKESEIAWHNVFKELNIGYNDVSQIIVTHYHPDHYGGSGWLQELTGAPVLIFDKEKKYLDRTWHDKSFPTQIEQFFLQYGIPNDIALDIKDEHISRYAAVSPHPNEITLVSDGDEIQLGKYRFQTIWSPGHTEGLMTLWSEKERIFLANDLVLPKITPNISFHVNSVENPLSDFLSSLRKIRDLPADITLPGHRQIITDLGKRVDEIIDHHGDRLENVKSILKNKLVSTDIGVSAWEISKELFGPLKEAVQHRFAFAETLSHLEYLVHANEIKKIQADNNYFYFL
ncbi:MBL fold metallo-hydrolase [Calidifontibacillus oryziterrae]|uniref:MBL fold metallo-hydrolase n=1 Tax=Calidifontibacillus oryziterrae TaxID=1191699 RepID=UPI0002FA7AF3|nr:MBL fold metallo-hydrolase [Calidifontibacillus oryziterrae]